MERKLCTVRRITGIKDIPGADLICAYQIDGWYVVSKKGEFQVDSLCLFFEIDSWIPTELAPFLSKGKEPSEYRSIKGERLRTVKLKGQISQGLILPVRTDYPNGLPYGSAFVERTKDNTTEIQFINEGDDLTEFFGILKWERPDYSGTRGGQPKGSFPSFIRKTDQERIQNIPWDSIKDDTYLVQEKLDGSSMTVYIKDGEAGVCSRNIDLKDTEDSSFWKVAKKYNLIEKIKSTGKNIAIQGEMVGPGIQGNKYNLNEVSFFGFNVWDIDKQENYLPEERIWLFKDLGIAVCPIAAIGVKIDDVSKEELLDGADDVSFLNYAVLQEGFVYNSLTDPSKTFKVISNSFLLKYKE